MPILRCIKIGSVASRIPIVLTHKLLTHLKNPQTPASQILLAIDKRILKNLSVRFVPLFCFWISLWFLKLIKYAEGYPCVSGFWYHYKPMKYCAWRDPNMMLQRFQDCVLNTFTNLHGFISAVTHKRSQVRVVYHPVSSISTHSKHSLNFPELPGTAVSVSVQQW